jgi:hypothetical protein
MRPDIAKLVQSDIEQRASYGEKKYGVRLQPHNGRNALIDAYQESLDLCLYLRQEIEERIETGKENCHVVQRYSMPKCGLKTFFHTVSRILAYGCWALFAFDLSVQGQRP